MVLQFTNDVQNYSFWLRFDGRNQGFEHQKERVSEIRTRVQNRVFLKRTNVKFSLETLSEEIQPVAGKNFGFEDRD